MLPRFFLCSAISAGLLLTFSQCLEAKPLADEEHSTEETAVVPAEPPSNKPAKKNKPHFAGVKRPAAKVDEKKKSSRVQNEWVKSKTHPKADKKEPKPSKEDTAESEKQKLDPSIPFFKAAAVPSLMKNRSFATSSLLLPDNFSMPTSCESSEEDAHLSTHSHTPAYPQLGKDAPSGHVYLTGDWLFWRTRQSGMEFAIQGASLAIASPLPHSKASKLNFDLQSGFRVGLGVHLPGDGWDIYLNYTDFRPHASKHIEGNLFPLLLFNPPSLVASANAKWKITFETLDIEIGRAYFIGKTLSFRPFIGMSGAWIDQDVHIHFLEDMPTVQTDTISFQNDFKGAGPRFGIGSNWILGKRFSLFGSLSTALMVGHFDFKHHQVKGDATTILLNDDLDLVCPVAQLIAGLAWDKNYQCDRKHVGISAGFECQYWWRQNQMQQFTDSVVPTYTRADDDLAMYGLTVRGRFDF